MTTKIIIITLLSLLTYNLIADDFISSPNQTTYYQPDQPFGGGEGTEENPFRIYTRKHLEELADSVNYGHY